MKRQLRRMFTGVGVPVRRLVRVRFGTLRLCGHAPRRGPRSFRRAERHQLDACGQDMSARRGLVVSLDGPGGSGKSTVGMRAARASATASATPACCIAA